MSKYLTKELLSVALKIPKNEIKSFEVDYSIVKIIKNNGNLEEYNIHEISYKCKEYIVSNHALIDIFTFYSESTVNIKVVMYELDKQFISNKDSEIDAIFECFLWVLSTIVCNK